MFRKAILAAVLVFLPMQAIAWIYYVDEDPISGEVYYIAEVFNNYGESFAVICSHESTGEYLGIMFTTDYPFMIRETEYVEYRIGNYTNESNWIAFNNNVILVVGTPEVDQIIDQFVEGDEAFIRTENTPEMMEFDITGGEEEIQQVIKQCEWS